MRVLVAFVTKYEVFVRVLNKKDKFNKKTAYGRGAPGRGRVFGEFCG